MPQLVFEQPEILIFPTFVCFTIGTRIDVTLQLSKRRMKRKEKKKNRKKKKMTKKKIKKKKMKKN